MVDASDYTDMPETAKASGEPFGRRTSAEKMTALCTPFSSLGVGW